MLKGTHRHPRIVSLGAVFLTLDLALGARLSLRQSILANVIALLFVGLLGAYLDRIR
jgi:hypothetical protein